MFKLKSIDQTQSSNPNTKLSKYDSVLRLAKTRRWTSITINRTPSRICELIPNPILPTINLDHQFVVFVSSNTIHLQTHPSKNWKYVSNLKGFSKWKRKKFREKVTTSNDCSYDLHNNILICPLRTHYNTSKFWAFNTWNPKTDKHKI